ncbi:unnamed protein product [Lathyrus oleraceus]
MAMFGVTNRIKTYCVNLNEETCACRKWDLSEIPCIHLITCISHNKKELEDFVFEYYRKSIFLITYSHIINPTNGPQLWLLDGQLQVNPPLMRRVIGHSKMMKNKTNYKPKNPHVLPMKLATITYHKCEAMGHNMRTCKEKIAADRIIPKGGNNTKNSKTTKGKKKSNKTATKIGTSSQEPQPI